MDVHAIRTALGLLQDDPDDAAAWESLRAAVEGEPDDLAEHLRLLGSARARHAHRGESEAVARLVEHEVAAATGTPDEARLLREQTRVLGDELLDDEGAGVALLRRIELDSNDAEARAAFDEIEDRRASWERRVAEYLEEAGRATDDPYRSAMLMRAAELALRSAREAEEPETVGAAVDRLEQAMRLDASNDRAGLLLELAHRRAARWEDVARVLGRLAERASAPEVRRAAAVRLARVAAKRLGDPARAAKAYERVLELASDEEALGYLSRHYEAEERWAELVSLYAKELEKKDLSSQDQLGELLQIAMLEWRKVGRAEQAEPWFDRIRKLDPAQPLVLAFYREWCGETGDDGRLLAVLSAAHKVMPEGDEKAAVTADLTRLAAAQESAQKAIEVAKSALRQNPDDADARERLERLYRQTEQHNALVELLRQQLERTPAEELATRVAILRKVARIYRTNLKSDTALVTVLHQIVQLDDKVDADDVAELRELVALYEKLGRFRDLLTHQTKLAEVTPDTEEKKALYRAVARRWLEQFSNAQNATEAYEALLALDASDSEARERLDELYRKRRAWPALFELYEKQAARTEGPAQLDLLREMAQLAAERLNRPADAISLYQRLLDLEPSRIDALDALEKQAERAKDWATLARALEHRVTLPGDDAARLAVLQKLGAVYAEHLGDPAAAASAWRRVLELQPGHARALRTLRDAYLAAGDYAALEELYGAQNDWDSLADVFSTAADRAKEPAQKVELSYRAAAVYTDRLGQPERALRSYERVLSVDPADARAASALLPIFEREEKWARLPPLYEVLLSKEEGVAERIELLRKLVEVTGSRLGDKKAAVAYARRAYDLAPEDEHALALLEEAARAAGSWDPFVGALEARLASLPQAESAPPPVDDARRGKKKKGKRPPESSAPDAAPAPVDVARRALELRLARLYADELGRSEDSIALYKRILASAPDDDEAAQALEALLRREDRRDDLRWLLELRVENAEPAEKARILGEWATLEEEVFGAPERAVDLLRRVLDHAPEDLAALRGLPRLLLAAGDAAGAAVILERHRDVCEGSERAEREIELAEVLLDRLDRPGEALDAAVRALDLDTRDARAVALLERLVERPEVKARAAEVLARAYAASGDARREAQALQALLEQSGTVAERLELADRLATVFEEKLESYGTALDVLLRALAEAPGELQLWERADTLAVLAGRPTDLAEALRATLRTELPEETLRALCERGARLHEDRLGDPVGATPYLEKLLGLEPTNEPAFRQLKDILTGAARWSELEALYDRTATATEDPTRRAELLVEVAMVCEEIIEDAGKATRHYERVIELDPEHVSASRALERLYERQERWADLAALLERRLGAATGDDLLDLEVRLAQLALVRLHRPEGAIGPVEDVLASRPNDPDARELAERLLEIGSLRGRAARALEAVYAARDEVRELVRVLGVRLEEVDAAPGDEAARDDERRSLLRQLATLRDERLHDDDGAFEALARLVPLVPDDPEPRERLLTIGRRMGSHVRVASVLDQAASHAAEPALRGEILAVVAGIQEDLLGDTAAAEATYRRVLALEAEDPEHALPAARALERIYQASGDAAKLAEMLRTRVRLESDGEVRRELLGRLGELAHETLGDAAAAIEAWRSRLEDDPADREALAALDRLYAQTANHRELVVVLERRRELSEDASERRDLAMRAARLLGGELADVPAAIDAWVALLDEHGPSDDALLALAGLYQRAERWDDLGDTYQRHLDFADEPARRLELLSLLGDLKRLHQSDVDGALEAYRSALTIDTGHGPSRAALEALLGAEDPTTRRQAAEILHPIYEADGDNERLLRVLVIEVDTADDPASRLAGLQQALRVAEGPLGDASRAYGLAERGVRDAAGGGELEEWLEHLERLAAATSSRRAQADLLASIAQDIFQDELQLRVTLRVAELAREELGDRERAREWYEKALELRSDDPRALVALERIHEEAGDPERLLAILERRTDAAETDAEKKALMYRRGALLAGPLASRSRAIEVYEAILDLAVEPEAVDALEKLYAAEGRHGDRVELHRRQLDAGVGEAALLHVKIARVSIAELGDVAQAFDELDLALTMDRQFEPAIAELERLLTAGGETETRARAAELLEPVYLLRADFPKVVETLRARLAHSQDPDERAELLTRLAKIQEEQKEDYTGALETMALLLHEDRASEDAIAELERIARVSGAERKLAEIYAREIEGVDGDDETSARLARRAGELFEQLGDLERALVFDRRALAFAPEDRALFSAVDGILVRQGAHAERVLLHRAALDHRFEPADRLETLHVIAGLERGPLGDPDAAIVTYRAALDVDDSDARVLDALTELYRARSRFPDLAELLERRAESGASPEVRAEYRIALARLQRGELGEPGRAIDSLEEIVRELPHHREALAELEALREVEEHKERVVEILRPLYASLDDWRHLVRLNEDRYALATDASEKVVVLRETAALWEERGHDLERARSALSIAVSLDPDDSEACGDYERLVERTSAWDELAETYDAALEDHPDLGSRRELLAKLASVHDRRRDDPRRALVAYQALHAADPSEEQPLREVDRLATLLSDWPALVAALAALAELVPSDDERASLWRRVGEARRDMLEDPAGAVEAYEKALELDPESDFTLDCLIDLYEQRQEPARLVELYEQRVERCGEDDADLRYQLLVASATVLETRLEERERAVEALTHALGVRPGDPEVLRRLEALYRAGEDWPALLENLRLQASSAAEPARRAELRRAIGGLLDERLSSHEEALEAYRLVLEDAPGDPAAIAAVRAIGDQHEDLREAVAGILVPVLRVAERWADLAAVLELRLTAETEPSVRAETLRAIAEVLEARVGDARAALGALLRALPERPEAHDLHADIERLAAACSAWPAYADALAERAGATFDPELGCDLWSRLGRVAEERLGDPGRAVVAYEHALELVGDRADLLAALDRLRVALGEPAKIAEVLERRLAVTSDAAELAGLFHRLAVLQIESLGEPARGVSSLREALDRDAAHDGALQALERLTDDRDHRDEAAEILEGVYRARGRTDALARLFEKRVAWARDAAERVERRKHLARVLESECSDAGGALRVLEASLADDPTDLAVLDEIERLAPIVGGWESAARSLGDALEKRTDLPAELGRELTVRVAIWLRDRVGDPRRAEAALVRALELTPESDETLVLVEQLQRVDGRERDLVETLRRRARLQSDEGMRDTLYQSARELAGEVKDDALAEKLLRELLERDDANAWALAELTTLRRKAGDAKETFSLLVRQIDLGADGGAVRALRRSAAELARDELNDPGKAIALFEQLFEDDPTDAAAAGALRALFESTAKWTELGRLLERLTDRADVVGERSALRLELARLHASRFDDASAAIELLRAVIEDDPARAEAVVELSALFEKLGRDEDLAELLAGQIRAAEMRGDLEAELAFQVRLGEVYESRLNDRARAIATYQAVLGRSAAHRGALESLARLHQAGAEHADAARVLERLLDLSEGRDALGLAMTLADEYEKLGERESAARGLERGLRHDERDAAVRGRLRALYESMGAWAELSQLVVGDAEAAEATQKKVELLRAAAAIQTERRGDPAAAADLLAKASALVPEDRELLLALSDALSASGRGKEAAEVLERIVASYGGKRSKELADIHRRLAGAKLADGNSAGALEELDKAFRIEPGNVGVLKQLGEVAFSVGDHAKAQQMYRALLLQKLDDKSPITKAEVFFQLGEIHAALGEKPKAIQQFERAVQTDASMEKAKARIAELKA
ncbi:MAG: tetratricopeptide repeat protein [Polyangiaceae bacterium]|nr:tetratricopeptide repeat protein [Polyangiaceae bacterium]